MPTLGEEWFAAQYPEALQRGYNDPWDFDWGSTPVEVKDCIARTKGNFVIKPGNHEQLVAGCGLYCFVLKRRLPSTREVVKSVRFVPANLIDIDEDRVRTETHVKHLNYTATKEVFRIHWKDIFEDGPWGWDGR